MKPIKTPGPSSLSPKPKLTPYTLPSGLTMHAADSVQRSSSAYMSKDDQSKRPIEANLGRRRCNSTPLTSSNVSTTTLMRLVPRPECGKHLQSTMPVNKPKSKKSWHTSGQGNNQTTRINGHSNGRSDLGIQAGVKVGTNQPAVHPLDGTRKGKDPSWLAVTLPRGPQKKKNFFRPGNMNWSLTSLGIMNQLVEGCPPALLCCHARAPEPAGPYHPPPHPCPRGFHRP